MRRSIRKRSSTREPTKAPFPSPYSPSFLVMVGKKAPFAAGIGGPPGRDAILSRQRQVPTESRFLEESASRGARRRPSRRPSRRPERQQIMLRRLLALGAALGVLIVVVLGVKGCLDARARGALSDYAG